MAVWFEVHCNVNSERQVSNDGVRSRCHSFDNHNPSSWQINSAKQHARSKGWVLVGRYWACCPFCKDTPEGIEAIDRRKRRGN